MAVVKISLQGTKALEVYNTLRAILQRMDLHIQNSNYYLTCFDHWCNMTNEISPEVSEKSLKSTYNFEIFVICLLMILILLTVLMISKCYRKRRKLSIKQQTYCLSHTLSPAKDTQVHFLALKQPVKN